MELLVKGTATMNFNTDQGRSKNNYASETLDNLRTLRSQLRSQESRVSYWRRIYQGRVDLLRAGLCHASVDDISHALLGPGPEYSSRYNAVLPTHPEEGPPPLSGLPPLWPSPYVDPSEMSDEDRVEQEYVLLEAEHRLSLYRKELHLQIDQITTELVCRYQQDPCLALIALQNM